MQTLHAFCKCNRLVFRLGRRLYHYTLHFLCRGHTEYEKPGSLQIASEKPLRSLEIRALFPLPFCSTLRSRLQNLLRRITPKSLHSQIEQRMEGKNFPSFYHGHLTAFRLFSYRWEEAKNPSVAFAQPVILVLEISPTRVIY